MGLYSFMIKKRIYGNKKIQWIGASVLAGTFAALIIPYAMFSFLPTEQQTFNMLLVSVAIHILFIICFLFIYGGIFDDTN